MYVENPVLCATSSETRRWAALRTQDILGGEARHPYYGKNIWDNLGEINLMRILVMNCGSSTLKFQLIEIEDRGRSLNKGRRLAHGFIDRIGGEGVFRIDLETGKAWREDVQIRDHHEASRRVLGWLKSSRLLEPSGLEAIGHRVVHGGNRFASPIIVDDAVLTAIEEVSELAPLHNEPALQAIRGTREVVDTDVPMVAVFDTSFHSTIPEIASGYPIPRELASKHSIRRYGFHGIAHRYMVHRYSAIVSKPLECLRVITLQLGNGCSVCAAAGGRSVDTSMGLTPLEGLMMGTRSGDVDPSLAGFIARREGVSIDVAEDWLNRRSGLLGVSEISHDMRDLLQAGSRGNPRATLAVEMFCYRVRKYIGAYLAVLGGADAIVFGGGIGGNSPTIRNRICASMDWCGLILDDERNRKAIGCDSRISADGSALDAYVTVVDEAAIIAQDTVRCLRNRQSTL